MSRQASMILMSIKIQACESVMRLSKFSLQSVLYNVIGVIAVIRIIVHVFAEFCKERKKISDAMIHDLQGRDCWSTLQLCFLVRCFCMSVRINNEHSNVCHQ